MVRKLIRLFDLTTVTAPTYGLAEQAAQLIKRQYWANASSTFTSTGNSSSSTTSSSATGAATTKASAGQRQMILGVASTVGMASVVMVLACVGSLVV